MRNVIVLTAAAMILATAVVAAEPVEVVGDSREILREQEQSNLTVLAYNELSAAVDSWHEAVLHGHVKQAKSLHGQLLALIKADIHRSRSEYTSFEKEFSRSRREAAQTAGAPGAIDDRTDKRDDRLDLERAQSLVKVKQRLFDSIQRSNSDSYNYRLVNDYLDVLRYEQQHNRVEIAEDVRELKEDRRDNKK